MAGSREKIAEAATASGWERVKRGTGSDRKDTYRRNGDEVFVEFSEQGGVSYAEHRRPTAGGGTSTKRITGVGRAEQIITIVEKGK